jgi:diguanylate cyclase (GGDEF)-like protein
MVRHHREHYDGSGYPDGLKKQKIPLGARIIAVADAYDTFLREQEGSAEDRQERALAWLEQAARKRFDPEVIAAFLSVADQANEQIAQQANPQDKLNSALEISRAQREVQSLYDLACSVGSTLCLNETLEILANKIPGIVGCSACVIFLRSGSGEDLEACIARGVNETYFRRSHARPGAFATARAAERGEIVTASLLYEDLIFESDPEDPWIPLSSSLVSPLSVNGKVIGTINLYHVQPDAFQADDMRVMAFVGEMAGQAVENARLFETTRESAYTDNLTGLRNTRFLHQFLEQEMSRSRRNHRPFAVLGLDLDRFKSVNDNFGHEQGDEVLRKIGRLFRTQVRQQDLVARNGGDEFVIVLPETDRGQALMVAAKIAEVVDRLAGDLIRGVPGFPRIGVSIGVAVFPEDGEDIQGLLTSADQGMYSNKRERQAA